MIYVPIGKTATGQRVLACPHVGQNPVIAITGGDGSDPFVCEFDLSLFGGLKDTVAFAFSRRTVVIWCHGCFGALPAGLRRARQLVASRIIGNGDGG